MLSKLQGNIKKKKKEANHGKFHQEEGVEVPSGGRGKQGKTQSGSHVLNTHPEQTP